MEEQPGTWHVQSGRAVRWSDAVGGWKDQARPVLVEVASTYNATIRYRDLAEAIQLAAGIRTRSLLNNWIGDVLAAVDLAQQEGEPLLSSLVVTSEGVVGPGYADPVQRREGSVPADLQWHAAEERLRCYQYFGAALPPGGGTPRLTPEVAAARARAARSTVVRPVCPTCNLRLPVSGTCDNCV
jgi:hypothetical protein